MENEQQIVIKSNLFNDALETLRHNVDASERRKGAQLLIESGLVGNSTIDAFVEGLMDNDKGVKDICAKGLSEVPPEHAYEASIAIAKLIFNKNIEIRNLAGDILVKIGPSSVDALKAYLQDDDSQVKQFVCDIMGHVATKTSVPIIQKLLDDDDINVRISAIDCLGKIADESTLGSLIQLYESSEELKPFILSSIGSIGGKNAEEFLLETLKNESDVFIKTTCIESLALACNDISLCSELLNDLPNVPEELKLIMLKAYNAVAFRLGEKVNLRGELRILARKALFDDDEDIRTAGLLSLGSEYNENDVPGLVHEILKDNIETQKIIIFNLQCNSGKTVVFNFFRELFLNIAFDEGLLSFLSLLPGIGKKINIDNRDTTVETICNIIFESPNQFSVDIFELMLGLNKELALSILEHYIGSGNDEQTELGRDIADKLNLAEIVNTGGKF